MASVQSFSCYCAQRASVAQGSRLMEPAAGTGTLPPGQRSQELALCPQHPLLGTIPSAAVQVLLGEGRGECCLVLPICSAWPLGEHSPSLSRWGAGPLPACLRHLCPLENGPGRTCLTCGLLGPASALGGTWSSCFWVWAWPAPTASGSRDDLHVSHPEYRSLPGL